MRQLPSLWKNPPREPPICIVGSDLIKIVHPFAQYRECEWCNIKLEYSKSFLGLPCAARSLNLPINVVIAKRPRDEKQCHMHIYNLNT